MVKCSKCENGKIFFEEDGHRGYDACYHCGASGMVDEQTDFEDRWASFIHHLARIEVSNWEKAINDSPDGEDVRFLAAENMCTVEAILDTKHWDYKYRIGKELEHLQLDTKRLLVDMYEGFTKPKVPANKTTDIVMPGAVYISIDKPSIEDFSEDQVPYNADDDIPF